MSRISAFPSGYWSRICTNIAIVEALSPLPPGGGVWSTKSSAIIFSA